jgi:hypothetical protein
MLLDKAVNKNSSNSLSVISLAEMRFLNVENP